VAKAPDVGVRAMHNYQEVRYSHLPVPPGAPYLLAADPWSFLHGYLEQSSKGKKGKRWSSAKYYAKQAEDFYRAASRVDLPTSATLVYYGMLNLAKTLLALRSVGLEEENVHHGATTPKTDGHKVKVQPRNGSVQIFHAFVETLGGPAPSSRTHSFVELCSSIPELHEIAFSLGHLPGKARKYLPVEISVLVNSSKKKAFTEMAFDKKHETRVRIDKFYRGERQSYFQEMKSEGNRIVYRSRARKSVNDGNWPRIYRNIQKEYKRFNIVGLLTRDGYKYYCDLEPGEYPSLANTLLAGFYLGSVARYRPSQVQGLMTTDLRPLVSEFVSLCPPQFLYQIVGLITERICVVPFARI